MPQIIHRFDMWNVTTKDKKYEKEDINVFVTVTKTKITFYFQHSQAHWLFTQFLNESANETPFSDIKDNPYL